MRSSANLSPASEVAARKRSTQPNLVAGATRGDHEGLGLPGRQCTQQVYRLARGIDGREEVRRGTRAVDLQKQVRCVVERETVLPALIM